MFKYRKIFVLVLVLFCAIAIFCSCSGSEAASKRMLETYWIEDYGINERREIYSGLYYPVKHYNYIEFDDQGNIFINDDYNEYKDGLYEFDLTNDGELTIYFYPKEDVLAIRDKQPAEWLDRKNELVLIGQVIDDIIVFESSRRDKEGKREFKKISREEAEEIIRVFEEEFNVMRQLYEERMDAYIARERSRLQ